MDTRGTSAQATPAQVNPHADALVSPPTAELGRYSERLAQAGAVPSVGSRGDSYDNALAESFNGLYKTELIRRLGPWQGHDDVEFATLEYIDWFNHRRLHGEIAMMPPGEFEQAHYRQTPPATEPVTQ